MNYSFYPKNTFFLNEPVNKTFDEVLKMSGTEFVQWVLDFRKKIVTIWDEQGVPPLKGYSEQEIIEQFNQLESHPVHKMFVKDEITGATCIRNTYNKLGNACNSWFPTMMKTKIDYGNGVARSIYDFMKEDDLVRRYMPYAIRHFKKDSFYVYSQCAKVGDSLPEMNSVIPETGKDFISAMDSARTNDPSYNYDYWLSPIKKSKVYTGYNEKLINANFHMVEHESNKDLIYQVRVYDKRTKIFPEGFKSFRVSVCQAAVNFPPLIAKALWQKYTEEFKDDKEIYIWDPSAGWGGRILGAMSVKDDRNVVYLGNDPNTDHTISKDYSSGGYGMPDRESIYTKYDDLAKFYNTETIRASCLYPHTNSWKVWQLGSEEMQHDPKFQQYKGKLSVVFTSPPYFHREVYSDDKEQSCHKFSAYDDWKIGFLHPTLKTAFDWLRPGGYILWNIASIKEGKKFIPLQEDSEEFMVNLGFEKVEVLQLALAQMPGSNRTKVADDGTVSTTNKNSVKIDGKLFRSEPIFVYRKPL